MSVWIKWANSIESFITKYVADVSKRICKSLEIVCNYLLNLLAL